MKDKVKKLLSAGYKQADVASILGCSPSYVSQLLKDEDFKKEVESSLVETASARTEDEDLDNRYDRLEHKVITAIEGDIENASFGEKIRALEVVSKRKELKRAPLLPAPVANVNIVNIQLPNHMAQKAAPEVLLNTQGEVIAIDNKSLAPMSSEGVKNIFKAIEERRNQVVIENQVVAEL